MAPKVLVVLSSHSQLGDTGKKTGWYLAEFAHPYDEFAKAGFDITVASPAGGAAPVDPSSVEAAKDDASAVSFLQDKKSVYDNTVKLSTLGGDKATAAQTAAAYDALFYPGGHGPMFDLVEDADSQRLVAAFAAAGKVVGAVCHGPAALASARVDPDDSNSAYVVAGKTVSAFTDREECAVQLDKVVPFLLETRLKQAGAKFVKAAEWQEKVAVDGNLITGQNPASAKAVGAAIVKALS